MQRNGLIEEKELSIWFLLTLENLLLLYALRFSLFLLLIISTFLLMKLQKASCFMGMKSVWYKEMVFIV